ncbi:tail fiber assembly protein [Buttiauxella sp.]|uniref:tail fiber assembly protein n=1 Tax=Buttiauxella sp. TaxID=1972222 RepID=UPI003C71F86A
MKYKYIPATNSFYPYAMESEYRAAGIWPSDGSDIDENTFASVQNPPVGKVRVAGSNGLPTWIDTPPLTQAQLITQADAQKQVLTNAAMQSIDLLQLKLRSGRTLTDAESVRLNAVLDYIDAVKATDTSSAPDIIWPTPTVGES